MVDIVFPSTVILSTSKDVRPLISVREAPNAIASLPIVTELLARLAFDIPAEPLN